MMIARRSFLALVVPALAGCFGHTREEIGPVTAVQVRVFETTPLGQILLQRCEAQNGGRCTEGSALLWRTFFQPDAEVESLRSFVNQRRQGWKPPLVTPASDIVSLSFLNQGRFVEVLGLGRNTLRRGRASPDGGTHRSASKAEIDELLAILTLSRTDLWAEALD